MATSRISLLVKSTIHQKVGSLPKVRYYATATSTGALLPEPQKVPFGLFGVVCAVIPGLLIGALISKGMANFLEENDLFVPSDDDDDDD